MEPLISIIIPAYNIESYIENCLNSVCEQSYQNIEVIAVDDGSTDQTGRIIDRLAEKDPRIVPIHKENQGVSAARNTGLEYAKGAYIGFVDGDDVIEREMYEILMKNALEYQADISHCGYQMIFPNRVDYYYNSGEKRIRSREEGLCDLIRADKVEPGLWNKLYKKELIQNQRMDETIRINEDLLFNYEAFKNAKQSVFEDVPLYHYRIRANSAMTSKGSWHKWKDSLKVAKKMMQQETGECYTLMEKRVLYLLEKMCAENIHGQENGIKEEQKECRRELKEWLQSGKLQAVYSKREWSQLKLALKHPWTYRRVHDVYAAMHGTRNKYRI